MFFRKVYSRRNNRMLSVLLPDANPVHILPPINIHKLLDVAIITQPITAGILAILTVFSLPMLSIRTPPRGAPTGTANVRTLAKTIQEFNSDDQAFLVIYTEGLGEFFYEYSSLLS